MQRLNFTLIVGFKYGMIRSMDTDYICQNVAIEQVTIDFILTTSCRQSLQYQPSVIQSSEL